MIGTFARRFSNAWKIASIAAVLGVTGGRAAPPNILHIHADDHRADGLHALGTPLLKTPNLDRLVEQGTTFTRCYTMGSMVGAVCLPSRSMMLSGRSLFRFKDAPTYLPTALAAAGYETWHMGKGGNECTAGLKAFQTSIVSDDRGPELRSGSSRKHADKLVEFLTARDRAKPFYVYLAPPVPHDPRNAEPQFHAMYDAKDVPLPAAFLPKHPWNNGDMAVRDEKLAPWPRTPENTKQQLADYYACISGLDFHVGRIFDALRATGQWTNTIIIFTGDNGLSMGEHGLFGKQNLYEFGGMHVPCVIAGPGIPKGRSEALVYLMDLFPTFCDLAGAKVPETVEGRSLAPILAGKSEKVRDVLYTAYANGQRAIRDDRWKLIRYPLVDRTQLFDLQADPHELKNLAEDADQTARVKDLTEKLAAEMQRWSDPVPLSVTNPAPADWTPPAAGAKGDRKRSRKQLSLEDCKPGFRITASAGMC